MPRCKHCQTKFEAKHFNQKYCLQSDECIKAFSIYANELTAKKKVSDWKAQKKVLKENTKKLSDYRKEARDTFQKWIRLRDKDLPCISCGTLTDDCWQGSHYFPANLYSGLVFDEMNVHKSCLYCNKHLHGNAIGYRIGLISRYGIDYVTTLENNALESKKHKYTKFDYLEIKEKYSKLIKELI